MQFEKKYLRIGKEVRQGGNSYLLFKNSDIKIAGCVLNPFLLCGAFKHMHLTNKKKYYVIRLLQNIPSIDKFSV